MNTNILYMNTNKIYPSIKEIDKKTNDMFVGTNVYVTEKIKGAHVRIHFDGTKTTLHSTTRELSNDKEYHEAISIFKKKYEDGFNILKTALCKVSFTLYGQILSGTSQNGGILYVLPSVDQSLFVFHDIFINDNWMNWDDFSELCKESGFKTVPLIYTGKFNNDVISYILDRKSKQSFVENQPMDGVVLKPVVEDRYKIKYNNAYTRLIGKMYSEKHKSKSFVRKSYPVIDIKNIQGKVNKIIENFCSDETIEAYWNNLLKESKIKIGRENRKKIITTLTKDSWDLLEDDICMESFSNNNMGFKECFSIAKKEFGKRFPQKIREIYIDAI